MNRAEQVEVLVAELFADAAKYPNLQLYYPTVLGYIRAYVAPDNGISDLEAREHVQVALAALDQYRAERLRQIDEVLAGPAAVAGDVPGEVYEREEPEVDGRPLPDGVDGESLGGRSLSPHVSPSGHMQNLDTGEWEPAS